MAKKKTKREAIDQLSKADILEVLLQEIERKDSYSSKKAQAAAFLREVDKYIKDERNLVLVVAKIR